MVDGEFAGETVHMTKASPEGRSETLMIRTTPSVKRMVEVLSEVEERSMVNVVERLIRAEFEKRGLVDATAKPEAAK